MNTKLDEDVFIKSSVEGVTILKSSMPCESDLVASGKP